MYPADFYLDRIFQLPQTLAWKTNSITIYMLLLTSTPVAFHYSVAQDQPLDLISLAGLSVLLIPSFRNIIPVTQLYTKMPCLS